MTILRHGTRLTREDQQHVLSAYVHRFTVEHKPAWARDSDPIHFANDADWLANTEFHVREDGRLDQRYNHCFSHPTWPANEEDTPHG